MLYIRLIRDSGDPLNLLYTPPPGSDSSESGVEALRHLSSTLSNPDGSFWWLDLEAEALRLQYSRKVTGCTVYQYDGEAPFGGRYVAPSDLLTHMEES